MIDCVLLANFMFLTNDDLKSFLYNFNQEFGDIYELHNYHIISNIIKLLLLFWLHKYLL